jgi:hypothetical protein
MIVSLEFPNASVAARFERYLKSGSGRAFAKWHFGPAEAAVSDISSVHTQFVVQC